MASATLQFDHSSRKATKGPDHFQGCKKCVKRKVSCHECVDQIAKLIGEGQFVEDYFPQAYTLTNDSLSLDQHLKEFDASMKNDHKGAMHDSFSGGDNSEKIARTKGVDDFMELDSYYFLASDQPTKPLDCHPIGVEKAAPWWRTTDKDILSSVHLESSSYMKNWDPTRFQPKQFESELHTALQCGDSASGHLPFVNKLKAEQHPSGLDGFSSQGLSQLLSSDSNVSVDTSKSQSTDSERGSVELSKSEILEALCHSQTRAREAEKLAQQACDEKEHVINLFFKQASYLFAYRQWLQILQLETLCLQFKSIDQCALPFPQFKNKRPRKSQGHHRRPTRRKQGAPRIKLNGCALAFALGFGLAGAGLIIGWTLGWLFTGF